MNNKLVMNVFMQSPTGGPIRAKSRQSLTTQDVNWPSTL